MACFCLIYTSMGLAVLLFTPRALKRAERLSARSAARFLFALRAMPFSLAVLVGIGICLPSYLWFEPESVEEHVSGACILLTCAGALELGIAVARSARAALRSLRFFRDCRQSGRNRNELLVIESAQPFLALAGVLRPRVVVSQGILRLLSAEELSVVLQHEDAHRSSRDNFKRLLAALNPVVPALERGWMRSAEYAADERAVAGDSRRALALASALVRVARFGQQPAMSSAISFLGDPDDLPARVERLLAPPVPPVRDGMPWQSALVAAGVAVLALNAITLRLVQSALESLVR
jgi:Zn-dependent protease with chaperone function